MSDKSPEITSPTEESDDESNKETEKAEQTPTTKGNTNNHTTSAPKTPPISPEPSDTNPPTTQIQNDTNNKSQQNTNNKPTTNPETSPENTTEASPSNTNSNETENENENENQIETENDIKTDTITPKTSRKRKRESSDKNENESDNKNESDFDEPLKKKAKVSDSGEATGDIYTVESIRGWRLMDGKQKYQVEWAGFPDDLTWEPIENVTGNDKFMKFVQKVQSTLVRLDEGGLKQSINDMTPFQLKARFLERIKHGDQYDKIALEQLFKIKPTERDSDDDDY